MKSDSLMKLDSFGKRLRVLRMDRQLTQTDVREGMEKLAGVKVGSTYISEMERNAKRPTIATVAAIALVLDISMDYLGLLIDEPESYKRDTMPEKFFSDEAEEIATIVDGLSPKHRAFLVETARRFASLTERQAERSEILDILNSIEKQLGSTARADIERAFKRHGVTMSIQKAQELA